MVNRKEAFKRWPSFLTFIIFLLKCDIGVGGLARLKSSNQRQHYSQQSHDPIRHSDKNCYLRSDILICRASLDNKESPQTLSKSAAVTYVQEDPYNSFPLFDKVLFKLFSASVTAEMQKSSDREPKNYGELMDLINEMTKTRSVQRVNDQGKNMLKRLFPPWLLTQYKWMFAAPFPEVPTPSIYCFSSSSSAPLLYRYHHYHVLIHYHHLHYHHHNDHSHYHPLDYHLHLQYDHLMSTEGQKPADDTCLNFEKKLQ